MQFHIAELAKELQAVPGQVLAVLHELDVPVEHGEFEADEDTLELVRESASELAKAKKLPLAPGRTPRDLATAFGVPDKEVLKALMLGHKVMATLTTTLDDKVTEAFVASRGLVLELSEPTKRAVSRSAVKAKASSRVPRPPVVTVLGHVDHGKTSLLDRIRKADVASGEAGGITQHIGAYQVEISDGLITFIDTPGHAAFTAMRARGAQVTDIAVLVVAADDGIMPQTIEAINHVKNAQVPIVVAVNKIDLPSANVDRVLTQLTQHELVPESFGGDVLVCPVSAATGEGVETLLENILALAELLELQADPKAPLEGVVIEAQLDKGRGPVGTVLVKDGTIKLGDTVVAGKAWGRLKAMNSYTGERVKEAGPSTPVEILGLDRVPEAGDKVEYFADEREARDTAEQRRSDERDKAMAYKRRRVNLRELREHMDEGGIRDLNLIVKADVQGSVEAVRGMLEKTLNEEVRMSVIHSGVGTITESDVLLASAADAICVGFNVKPEPGAKREAERLKVEIRTYTIIYELVEDIEAALKGMLEPKFEERYHGTVEVRAVFKLTRSGLVAGCHVTDGKITRNSLVRVRRAKDVVFEGRLASLKNVKQDVREMNAGQDCGLKFEGWEDFAVGDVIEAYEMVQVG